MAKNREKAKRKISLQQQEPGEDWCFECKDGGHLVVCDHKKCGKVYHPDCVGKNDSFFDTVKSWVCGRHYCFNCNKPSKFCCLGCPNAVCKKCVSALEFIVVRGVKGLCGDCLEIVQIIEQNLEHDSEGMVESCLRWFGHVGKRHVDSVVRRLDQMEGSPITRTIRKKIEANGLDIDMIYDRTIWRRLIRVTDPTPPSGTRLSCCCCSRRSSSPNKISLDDQETYECLFKDYWENVKVKEGLTGDDVSAALPNCRKGKKSVLHASCSESEDDSNCNEDYRGKHKLTKRKRYNSMEFVGWGSKPLFSFLASIGKYEIEPLTQWRVRSLICEYIKEKNLYHPKDKRKFLPDDKLFPIFRKKVMSKYQIYSLLEFHFAKDLDDSAGEKNYDKNKNSSTDKHINDQTCLESRLSGLIGKPLLKKGDLFTKPSCFASINTNNINLIYLKRSLVLELSKQPENFVSKVVGTFVRAKVDSDEHKQRKSHQLVRVIGVVCDETSNGILLQVSFMPKAIHISELSDEDFTEQECEDLRQKVKTSLLPKLTVGELQEKAVSLHEDITKHRNATRLVYLQNQIDRANLRGRTKEKIALLEEREELEQPWKQEQLLRRVPSVFPEFMEARYDDSDEDNSESKI